MGSRSNLAPPQGAAAPPPSSPMPAAPAQAGPSPASAGASFEPATLNMPMHSGGGMQATTGPDGNIQVGSGILQPQMFPMNGGGTGIAPPAPGAGVAKCPTCGK